ncbi:PadR family transcriptional regulator [Erythrobacter sp. HA6-11]
MQQTVDLEIAKWLVQMRKGAAEFAVLSLLKDGASYGSKLLDSIAEADKLNLSEGSIYPLLKRLEKDEKIWSTWEHDEDAAHPRKYYELTLSGRRLVEAMSEEWAEFSKAMDAIQKPGLNQSVSKAGYNE